MINEKIEEAAKMYAFHKCDERDIDQYDLSYLLENAFKTGINWFLDNLWHDASEEPKEGKRVIVELKNREGQEKFYISDRDPLFDWNSEVKCCGYIRWFYVEDLLKGGK